MKALPGKAFQRVAPGSGLEVAGRSPFDWREHGFEGGARGWARSQQGETEDVVQKLVAVGLR